MHLLNNDFFLRLKNVKSENGFRIMRSTKCFQFSKKPEKQLRTRTSVRSLNLDSLGHSLFGCFFGIKKKSTLEHPRPSQVHCFKGTYHKFRSTQLSNLININYFLQDKAAIPFFCVCLCIYGKNNVTTGDRWRKVRPLVHTLLIHWSFMFRLYMFNARVQFCIDVKI